MSDNLNNAQEEQQQLTLQDLWTMCIARWHWFVGAVVVCLAIAALYISSKPPVFSSSASVLIKENSKSASIGDVSQTFTQLGFGTARVNVYNEILSFQSPDLMVEVAKRLHLDINYRYEGGLFKTGHRLYDRTLYGASLPLVVEFPDFGNSDGISFRISQNGKGELKLKDIVYKGEKLKESYSFAPGDTVSTTAGRIVISKPAFSEGDVVLDEDLLVNRTSYYSAGRRYRGALSASLSDKMATVINLSLSDVNTQRAVDILDMLINVYNENWIKDKNLVTTSTNEFISDRLNVIEQELGNVDSNISDFKSRNRTPDIKAAASMDMQLTVETGRQITDISNQISIAQFLLTYIGDSKDKLLPADAGLRESNISGMINNYNSILLQRNRLVESSSEDNFLVKDMDGQLSSMRSAIISSINNYITAQNMLLRSYQSTQSRLDARVESAPQQAGQLLSDERQQKVKEALYIYLLQKREENQISQAFTAYNTRVISQPYAGSSPIAPRKMMILLVALALGFGLPFAAIYVLEITNTKVRSKKDLEHMAAPIAGEIPPAFAKKRHAWDHLLPPAMQVKDNPEDRKIVVKPHSRNIINEAFRVVRTNIEFMSTKNENGTVIMFTSANPSSGKTFLSSNLATAFAIKGKKSIVLDLDLRKKSLSTFAGNPKKGISNYLAHREDDFHTLIVHNIEGTGLDILPVGMLPPNPAELLADERLGAMIGELRKEYDFIFLDCPPAEIVTDADIINPFTDITIFVIRAGVMDRRLLPDIDRYYNDKKYRNMVLVLNGTEVSGRYGYRYGYGRYGYHYGSYGSYGYDSYYGSDKEEEVSES